MPQNTLYIAEPIFSSALMKFDSEITFPPIKKIGITTNHPQKREKELMGTLSPVKISIVKAWTNIEAKDIETMIHTLLDNTRLDGEYFWDGNETLVDAISDFIGKYHPEAEEIIITDDPDVKTASDALNSKNSTRIYTEVLPLLKELGIDYKIYKNEKGVIFQIQDYKLRISAKSAGKYTLTIFSKNRSTENALEDFPDSVELTASASDDSNRKARIPLESIEVIMNSIKQYQDNFK